MKAKTFADIAVESEFISIQQPWKADFCGINAHA